MDYKALFAGDKRTCRFTGIGKECQVIHQHHVFGQNRYYRKKSEEYGYVIPVVWWLHELNAFSIHENADFRTALKQMAQRHFEEHYGSRELFVAEFGRNYLGGEEEGWEIDLKELGVPVGEIEYAC